MGSLSRRVPDGCSLKPRQRRFEMMGTDPDGIPTTGVKFNQPAIFKALMSNQCMNLGVVVHNGQLAAFRFLSDTE